MMLLRQLGGGGTSVVAVLHDLNLAAAYADRVVLLSAGRIDAYGTPWEVLTGPRLSAAYGQSVEVIQHPFRDCPLVLARTQDKSVAFDAQGVSEVDND